MNIIDAIIDGGEHKQSLEREAEKQSYLAIRDGKRGHKNTSIARYNKRRLARQTAARRRKNRRNQVRDFHHTKMMLSRVDALLFQGGLIPDASGEYSTTTESEMVYAHRLLVERFGSVDSALQVRAALVAKYTA